MNTKGINICLLYLLTILCVFVCSTQVFADEKKEVEKSWKLIYENDEEGNVLSGDLNKLINAVKNGADIKIVVSVTIGSEEDAVVFNVLPNSVGVTSANIVYVKHVTLPNSMDSDGVPFLYEDKQQVQLFRSDGVREILQYNMSGTTITRHDSNMLNKIKWYVNK